jgi:hypothetical protein
MHKLRERRLTNTPQGISQALCNCGLWLNSPEGRDSATGLKISVNSPDAALTGFEGVPERNLRVSVVKTPFLIFIRRRRLSSPSFRKESPSRKKR